MQSFCWGRRRKEVNSASAWFCLEGMALGISAPAAQTPLASSINRLQWLCWVFFFPFNEVKMLYLCVHPKAGSTVHGQGWQHSHSPLPWPGTNLCQALVLAGSNAMQQCTFGAAFKGLTSPSYTILCFTANLLFHHKWTRAVLFFPNSLLCTASIT